MNGGKIAFRSIIALFIVLAIINGAFPVKARFVDVGVSDGIIISTKVIKSTDQYMETDIKTPVIEGLINRKIQAAVNSSFEKDALDFKNTIEKQAREGYEEAKKGNYPFHSYQAYIEYKVTYNRGNILSIPVNYYSYTGGAHGMTTMITRNINLNTGKDISLKDVFKEGVNYSSIIKQMVIKQINMEPEIYFEDAAKTVEKFNEEFSFYFENGNIVVYYPLYLIAPYASGIREFKIPLETFGNEIIPEYKQTAIYKL